MTEQQQEVNRILSMRGELARELDVQFETLRNNGGDTTMLVERIAALNAVRVHLREFADELAVAEARKPIVDPQALNRKISRLAAEIHELEEAGLPRDAGHVLRQRHAQLKSEHARHVAMRDKLLNP